MGVRRSASMETRRLLLMVEESPAELRRGLCALRQEYPSRFGGRGAWPVRFICDRAARARGLAVAHQADGVTVRYARRSDAFRALGRLMGASGTDTAGRDFAETPRFDMRGVMWDCSRNGVLRPDALRALLLRCALMGINTVLLYTEDTYTIPGEPFFGYLRGRYSAEALRALDAYASDLGVEMIPYIQTLGHLEQVLKWPAYHDLVDVAGVLMAEEAATYALVEKMIRAASAPFRSRRIHIGMDEAHGVGTGRYRARHGTRSPFDVFNRHLGHVLDICRRLGLAPLINGDMYFRLGSKTHDYYDQATVIPPRARRMLPKDLQLVYWDYYHQKADFYVDWIARHRELGAEPVVSGGLWTWQRFWAQLPYTFLTLDACMSACKASGVREVFVTAWGDDGNECDPFSALAGIQYFAEHAYADRVDSRLLRRNFHGSCDAELESWIAAGSLDCTRRLTRRDVPPLSMTKGLLWDDPILGLTDGQYGSFPPAQHYARAAGALQKAARRGSRAMRRLAFPAAIAEAVACKTALRRELLAAYRARDRKRLRRLLNGDIPAAQVAVSRAWKEHRRMWMATYEPSGFEVIEGRYGALLARLDHLRERVASYVRSDVDQLSELDVRHHPVRAAHKLGYHPDVFYARVATASCVR